MTPEQLRQFAADPAAFQAALVIPSARGPARFADCMADFQRERFAQLNPALVAVAKGEKPPIGRYFWSATKGASKDSDLAVCLLWLLAFTRRPLFCQVGAADQDQAGELRKAAKDILRLNTWLAKRVQVQAWKIVCDGTESTCEIIAADVAGSHGARPDVLILNELSHVTKDEFADNLLDNAAKVPHGLVVLATNAGFVGTWQWNWLELARTSDRWIVNEYSRPSPWLDPAAIEEARRRSRTVARFMRLWWGIWAAPGSGDALSEDEINRAVVLAGPTLEPEIGWIYLAGLDVGIKRDATALVTIARHVGHQETRPRVESPPGCLQDALVDLGFADEVETDEEESDCIEHAGTGRTKLVDVQVWKATPGGKVSLGEVKEAVLSLHARFGLSGVGYDTSQMARLAEELEAPGIAMVEVPPSTTNVKGICQATLDAFTDPKSRIELYDDPVLMHDLRELRVLEKSYGVRLVSPKDEWGHGDVVNALGLALFIARGAVGAGQASGGDLVCWP